MTAQFLDFIKEAYVVHFILSLQMLLLSEAMFLSELSLVILSRFTFFVGEESKLFNIAFPELRTEVPSTQAKLLPGV